MLLAFIYISHFILVLSLGYYLFSVLQWYSYKINRVLFHFSKPHWHIIYFAIPIFAYYFTGIYFWIYFYFAYIFSLIWWYKKLDKPLVFTQRVKRFFIFLALFTLFLDLLCFKKCEILGIFMPIIFALLASYLFEKILFSGFIRSATKKLQQQKDMKIITITASYGKTSIKNFLFEILKDEFICYKTPRSVNTYAGLVQDINVNLPKNTQLYITEAGAREEGDILQISNLLNPHICIVGQIGMQHIEYFKSIENVRKTKLELLNSKNMQKAFLHVSTNMLEDELHTLYANDIVNVNATLDGTHFTLHVNGNDEEFFTPLLGKFNAYNLSVCIKTALYLNMDLDKIKQKISKLKSVEHRLFRMDSNNKIIIDDSFNGNFEGMSASYELVSSYSGKKVLITPGIVESTKEENQKLAKIMNEVFDIVILTGSLNASIIAPVLTKPKIVFLKQKSQMQEVLLKYTNENDLILFSNDAPEYI